jgi:hypothetical protein
LLPREVMVVMEADMVEDTTLVEDITVVVMEAERRVTVDRLITGEPRTVLDQHTVVEALTGLRRLAMG